MSKVLIALALCLTLLTGLPATAADAEEQAQAAIDTRQGLLKVVVSYFGPIVGMARGQIPYDADVVKNNAGKVAVLLPMIPDVFRKDTRDSGLESEALDEIWDNMSDFQAKTETATERALALAAATADGQEAAM